MDSSVVLVIIVSYGNKDVIDHVLAALLPQLKKNDALCIFDNGDGILQQTLDKFSLYKITVFKGTVNVGFCGGNNLALKLGHWQKYDYVLLLNPDLVLPPNWINDAIQYLNSNSQNNIGILSGPLLKYNFVTEQASGLIDSLGIDQTTFSGRWHDVGAGSNYGDIEPTLSASFDVKAICGALMLLPTSVVAAVMVNDQLFDERFFAYKEDIDLSLRVKKAGYRLRMVKALAAYHGRGWKSDRASIPFKLRALAARNDVLLHAKHGSPYIVVSVLKWLYVHTIERIRFAKAISC